MTNKQIENTEETVLRLHTYLRRLESENNGFSRIIKKIEKKGLSPFTQKEKIETSLWGEYKYYKGKMLAYMFVLGELKRNEVPFLIERLRGMKNVGNKIIETK